MPDIHEQQEIHDINYARKLIKECKETQNPYLDIGRCGITDLNYLPELFDCTHLETLILSNIWWDFEKNEYVDSKNIGEKNILSELPEEIGKLTNLRVLIACGELFERRTIDDISPLSNLTSLTQLDLMDNKLTDISPLSNLTSLTVLNLISNNIVEIPEEIFKLNMDINIGLFRQGLSIDDNIESPPIEIIKQGKEAVFDWFAAENRKAFNEVKVILIGDGGAGKTSLLRRLQTGEFDENEAQTDGINIEDIDFSDNKQFKEYDKLHPYKAHFWDFGGQDIINSTHRFFLTKRSIYLIVHDARKDKEAKSIIKGWVKDVSAIADDSPILIIVNQIDVNNKLGFDDEALQEEFPQIVKTLKVSCKTEEGLDDLKSVLEQEIPNAKLVNSDIDVKWIKLRENIQKYLDKNNKEFLNDEVFNDLCIDSGIHEEQRKKNAIDYFHHLGLFLHFDQIKDYEYYVLDPLWITYAVFQVLTSQEVAKKDGIFLASRLFHIITKEKNKNDSYKPEIKSKFIYTKQQCMFIKRVLSCFNLCYCTNDGEEKIYIPKLFKEKSNKELRDSITNSDHTISLVYTYTFLPKYILPTLMVKLNKYIEDGWSEGFAVKHNASQALIVVDENKISITACGDYDDRIAIMSYIRTYLEELHQGLEAELNIPLDNNQSVKYSTLKKRQQRGKLDYEVEEPEYKCYSISKLLEGVKWTDPNEEIRKELLEIKTGVYKRNVYLIDNYAYLYDYLKENKNFSQNIFSELQDLKEIDLNANREFVEKLIGTMQEVAEKSENIDTNTRRILSKINTKTDSDVKLKLAVPIIPHLVSLEAETSVKGWPKAFLKSQGVDITAIEYYLDKWKP